MGMTSDTLHVSTPASVIIAHPTKGQIASEIPHIIDVFS